MASIYRLLLPPPLQHGILLALSVASAVFLLPTQRVSADALVDLREAVLASDADGVRAALSEGANIDAPIEKKKATVP